MTSTPLAASGRGHYGIRGIVASEWTKLRSVRSTVWTLLITVVAGVGISAIITSATASRWADRSLADQAMFDPTRSSLAGLLFAQLAVGVLAVLIVSAEYSTGTIRATLAAVPRRPLVLAAKVLVFGALVLVTGELTSFAAFGIGQQVLSGHTPTASLSDPEVVRAVVSGGLYLTALGLLGLGLAAIVRHTAAAISTYVGVLFILPVITAVLPSSLADDVSRFLPAAIGTAMISAHRHTTNAFGPWPSFAILAGYAAAALVAGGILLTRRDA
jgi:ABC-2 type transport system permease protein